jgi:hypothetical protein
VIGASSLVIADSKKLFFILNNEFVRLGSRDDVIDQSTAGRSLFRSNPRNPILLRSIGRDLNELASINASEQLDLFWPLKLPRPTQKT